MNYLITVDLANKVLNYLASRPYVEVNQLIFELSKLEKVEENKEIIEENGKTN